MKNLDLQTLIQRFHKLSGINMDNRKLLSIVQAPDEKKKFFFLHDHNSFHVEIIVLQSGFGKTKKSYKPLLPIDIDDYPRRLNWYKSSGYKILYKEEKN